MQHISQFKKLANKINLMVENSFSPKEFLPVAAPVHSISCEPAFAQLEPNEALYAYYMTRASWEGAKICWF